MFEDVELDDDYEEGPPPEETDNRTFLIAAGVLGGITLLALICMAAYVLLIAPGQRNANNQELTAIAAQNTEAALVERAQTQTARAPTATLPPTSTNTPTATSSPTPVIAQPTDVLGRPLETTDDLTPETIAGIAAAFPDLLDSLTEEILLALKTDVLAALPESFLSGLAPDLQAKLEARLNPPDPNPSPVDLPAGWIAAAAIAAHDIATTDDLTVEIVIDSNLFEGDLLDELTPEVLLALPLDVLAEVPDAYLAELDPLLRAQLEARLDPFDPNPPPVNLPDSWREAATQLTAMPTVGPRTATVAALLTQAAQQTQTVIPTATALPDTGFADDIGAPSLLALAVLFVVVIFLVRRLRKINA